jgi:RNA polymerase sigma-70 factor (ECF subfamily)
MSQQHLERYEQIVLPHLDDAYTLARYLVGDEHDAQDIVQDAALRALRFIGGYSGGDSRAWLLAIVRNCAIDLHRRRRGDRNAVDIGDGATHELASSDESDHRAIQRSERARIARAVAALPVEYRELIVLREVQELSYKEISNIIGAPLGTVMSRLARARKRLAGLLGADAQEAS